MQLNVPDSMIDALRQALIPILETLVDERVEQRRTLLLSVADVAEQLRCSRSSVLGLIHGGHLEAVRLGRTHRVASRVLEDYVEELTRPPFACRVVGSHAPTASRAGAAPRMIKGRPRAAAPTQTLPATKPPRSPRTAKAKKLSPEESAEQRCTAAEFADRWWGMESAVELLTLAGVPFAERAGSAATFRYGDLVDWMREHTAEFEAWTEEFDPVLGGRGSRPRQSR